MADRADLYRAFAERFHAGKRLRPATAVPSRSATHTVIPLIEESS